MGFLNRFLRRRRGPRIDRLPTPWGDRTAIYEAVRSAARPDGSLPPDFELPDTPAAGEGIRWAPGALDGVMSHHGQPDDETPRAAAIAEEVVALTRAPSAEGLARLQARVTEEALLACVDELTLALIRTPDLDADRLHEVGRFLATRAADREMVKLGMAVLGLVVGTDDRELLLTLGAHDELALFAIVALSNRPDAGEHDLWELARRARGWGRIQAVERLAGTNDSAIQRWMREEGFRNEVMDEYLAHVCASSGRLAPALEGDVDEALLGGAAGILEALVVGGPAPGIADYEEGAEAAERFLDHVAARASSGRFDLELLGAVARLREFLASDQDWDQLASSGWTVDHREGLEKVADAILARPEWEEAIQDALDTPEQEERWRGEHLARLVGVDTFERLEARLEHEPVDDAAWFDLMRQASTAPRLERALSLAESLPLEAIASGPADELGLGPEFRAHRCLDVIVQDLDRFPGKGWPILRAAIRSPVVRNRNMAVRALAAWPREDWAEDTRAVLESAHAAEPDDALRARIDAALEGRALD